MSDQGILAVVSGFSGAGKGTLMKELLKRYGNYALSVSATTRPPREGEIHGREYFFLTEGEFERMIAEDQLLEYAHYVDHYYGTPKRYVYEQLAAGKDVILEIEIQGALAVKEKFADALLLFVAPPDIPELRRRLTGRGTESEEDIEARLARAREEAKGMDRYDYLLVNDDLDACVEEMHRIIRSQHAKVGNNGEFIAKIRRELGVSD